MRKLVTKTKKAPDGDIIALCQPGAIWSPVSKVAAIREIKLAGKPYSSNSPFCTEYDVAIVVVEDAKKGEYLRTDPDRTQENNLGALPDC